MPVLRLLCRRDMAPGDDINLYGPGTPVQQWMTYRDAETYRSIVRKGPLFPLNSLMYHGIVSAENAYYGLENRKPIAILPIRSGAISRQVRNYRSCTSRRRYLTK